jgi:hypothetical protein
MNSNIIIMGPIAAGKTSAKHILFVGTKTAAQIAEDMRALIQ